MRLDILRRPIAMALMALALSACSHRGEAPVNSTLNEDDDTFCRAGGKVAVGSSEYVACRKDRDAQRANQIARTEKKQHDLGEFMIDHPAKPP
jgi:hypothetical protein